MVYIRIYPADFTFVCPTELEDVQNSYAELKELGCEVYSVSCDSEFVHKAWSDASPSINKIEYYMLADKKHELAELLRCIPRRICYGLPWYNS